MDKQDKRSRRKILLGICGVLCVGVIAGSVVLYFSRSKNQLELANNATVGILPGVDMDERLKQLQTQLDESQIAFSINTSPVFATGSSDGNLLVENPANNAKLLTFTVVLDETGEVVYESKALRPGTYLENIRLSKNLTKGSYPATVYLKAYREESQEFIGQTGAAVTIQVLA